jgi:hypothetical protein
MQKLGIHRSSDSLGLPWVNWANAQSSFYPPMSSGRWAYLSPLDNWAVIRLSSFDTLRTSGEVIDF